MRASGLLVPVSLTFGWVGSVLLIGSDTIVKLPPRCGVYDFIFLLASELIGLLIFTCGSIEYATFMASGTIAFTSFTFNTRLGCAVFSP